METQTLLSCHYKFILAENITILSVSSDDFLPALPEVAEQQIQTTKYKQQKVIWRDREYSNILYGNKFIMTT